MIIVNNYNDNADFVNKDGEDNDDDYFLRL